MTVDDLRHDPCWPMLLAFAERAHRAADEGPLMAAWTTLSFTCARPLAFWRAAVPVAFAASMAAGRAPSPAGWRSTAWMLGYDDTADLKDAVSYVLEPETDLP